MKAKVSQKLDSKSSQNKKATITLYLDKKILDDIRKDANTKRLSINAMINDILTKYRIDYKNYEDFQCHILTHKNFKVMLDNVDEDILLEDFKSNATDLFPTLFLERNIPFTLINLIK